ncbi:hypothetical protein Aperf_G00000126623 [Anoplocephala perfoliata]
MPSFIHRLLRTLSPSLSSCHFAFQLLPPASRPSPLDSRLWKKHILSLYLSLSLSLKSSSCTSCVTPPMPRLLTIPASVQLTSQSSIELPLALCEREGISWRAEWIDASVAFAPASAHILSHSRKCGGGRKGAVVGGSEVRKVAGLRLWSDAGREAIWQDARAGSRTRIDCLEGSHDNRYTTHAQSKIMPSFIHRLLRTLAPSLSSCHFAFQLLPPASRPSPLDSRLWKKHILSLYLSLSLSLKSSSCTSCVTPPMPRLLTIPASVQLTSQSSIELPLALCLHSVCTLGRD